MKLRALPIIVAALMALSCQTAGRAEAAPEPELSQLYGDYLAASYASEIGDAKARQRYYMKAFESAPDDIRIGRRAIVSAIETGDMATALRLAKTVNRRDKTESMARAVLGVDAFRRGRESRAVKYFSGASDDLTMTLLMQLVRGWVEVDQGKLDDARDRFIGLGGADYFDAFGQLQIAKLELREGNFEAADAALELVEDSGISGVESALTRARLEVARGNRDVALEGLKVKLDENEGFTIGPIAKYAEALEAGKDLPILDIKAQAARALTDPSFAFFARNRSRDGATLYLRFASWIDPRHDKPKVWLSSILEEDGEAGQAEAYKIYRNISEDSDYYTSSQLSLANIYLNQEKDDEAVETLEKLNARENTLLTRESLGRARFFRENYAEALPFYDDLVNGMTEEEIAANVEPLRFRAIILERLKRWPEAEADFKRVLSVAPEDVDTLNYLGYTWVDRGENLTEAFEMIRKAVEMEPQSGAIVDSLGWAHYKLGQYDQAKDKLEDAVALSPSSATIIDHLGDVYWKLGRKREAGFQWQRALEFDPTDEERAMIKIKLKSGLDVAQAQPKNTAEALP